MINKKLRSPKAIALVVLVAGVGISAGVVMEVGFSLAIIPVIVGGFVIWGIVWIGGFQVGAAFADWLERRWYR